LTATALVFQPIDQSAATSSGSDIEQILIAVDHCLLWAREMEALLDSVARDAAVARERLLVVFSHTHAAGLMDTDRQKLPGRELIARYLESLALKLAELVRAARTAVRPATIVYGCGHCRLAANRDYRDEARGQFVCGFNPDGEADDTVLVARATDDEGKVIATFV